MRRTTFLSAVLLGALAVFGGACEKSDDAIVQEQFREAANACPEGCVDPPPGCVIKGNVGGTGLKFFILPEDERWPLAVVDPAKGERWFCNAREAQDNGFQPVPAEN